MRPDGILQHRQSNSSRQDVDWNFVKHQVAPWPELKRQLDGVVDSNNVVNCRRDECAYVLTQATLRAYYGVDWFLPRGTAYLVPGVPGRLGYIQCVVDLLLSHQKDLTSCRKHETEKPEGSSRDDSRSKDAKPANLSRKRPYPPETLGNPKRSRGGETADHSSADSLTSNCLGSLSDSRRQELYKTHLNGLRWLDVGTGANAIYAILLKKHYGASEVLVTETDRAALEAAEVLLRRNDIAFTRVEPETVSNILVGIDPNAYDVVICNPPFYPDMATAERQTRPGMTRTGTEAELVYSHGGALAFIKQMIKESKYLDECLTEGLTVSVSASMNGDDGLKEDDDECIQDVVMPEQGGVRAKDDVKEDLKGDAETPSIPRGGGTAPNPLADDDDSGYVDAEGERITLKPADYRRQRRSFRPRATRQVSGTDVQDPHHTPLYTVLVYSKDLLKHVQAYLRLEKPALQKTICYCPGKQSRWVIAWRW